MGGFRKGAVEASIKCSLCMLIRLIGDVNARGASEDLARSLTRKGALHESLVSTSERDRG